VYTGIDFNPELMSFVKSAAAVILCGMCGSSLGLFISVIAPTIEIASAMQPAVFIPFMLTSGYLKNYSDIAD